MPPDVPDDHTSPPASDAPAVESTTPAIEPDEPVSPVAVATPETWREADESEGASVPSPAPAVAAPIVDDVPLSSQVRRNRSLWSTRLSLLLVAALVGGLAGHFAAPSSSNNAGLTIKEVGTAPGAAILPNGVSIPKLVQKALPTIVSIDVKGGGTEDQGTGMIISKGGLVVTNNHVIAAAVNGGTITITRSGSTKSEPATLVGTNPIDDVALIRINNASNLPTVTFGNSNALVAGDAVDAEVAAKSLFLAGSKRAAAEANAEGMPAVLVTEDGRTLLAGGLA